MRYVISLHSLIARYPLVCSFIILRLPRPRFGAGMLARWQLLTLSLILHLPTSYGFSFTIDNTPQQCSDLNISIIGSGQPPYTAVIVPYGPTSLANNVEVREVLDVPFSGVSTSTSLKLTYPENSQFVVVVRNPPVSAVEQVPG